MLRSLLVLVSLFVCASAKAQQSALSPATAARIDAMFARFDRVGSPGYAVGIVKDGKLVFAKGYGRANLDDDLAITAATSFHIASLSKQFTAAAIALLILDHKLTLETPVAQYFPEIAKFHADIRVKHLIYFTSGLPEYTSLPRANGDPWYSAYYFTIDDAIAATMRAKELNFAPGTKWEYSNVDYMLLAKIVEKVSGMSLADFLRERVFAPLDMRSSLLNDDATTVIPHRATGYVERGNPKIRAELAKVGIRIDSGPGFARLVRNSPHYGGSGVFSTLEDLAKWDESFYTNSVAGPAFSAQMLSRMKFAHDKDNDAFGLVFGTFKGRQMIWFSGGDLDTSTYMARFPDQHLTVIVLSNLLTGDAEGKAMEIMEMVVR